MQNLRDATISDSKKIEKQKQAATSPLPPKKIKKKIKEETTFHSDIYKS
jgi:hypothetical protein